MFLHHQNCFLPQFWLWLVLFMTCAQPNNHLPSLTTYSSISTCQGLKHCPPHYRSRPSSLTERSFHKLNTLFHDLSAHVNCKQRFKRVRKGLECFNEKNNKINKFLFQYPTRNTNGLFILKLSWFIPRPSSNLNKMPNY